MVWPKVAILVSVKELCSNDLNLLFARNGRHLGGRGEATARWPANNGQKSKKSGRMAKIHPKQV